MSRARSNRRSTTRILGLVWLLLGTSVARAEEFEGVLEIGIAERFPGLSDVAPMSGQGVSSADASSYHLTLSTGQRRIELAKPVNGWPGFAHGERVRVEGEWGEWGEWDGDVLQPSSISKLASSGVEALRSAAVPPTETLGAQATLVTLLNFTNDTSQPATNAEVNALLLDEAEPSSTAAYLREASYGRAWLSGGVVGWLPVSYDDSDCQIWTSSGFQDLIEELDPLIDFAALDRWIVVIPQNPNCGFVGYSSLGKQTWATADGSASFSRFIMNGVSTTFSQVAAHELGHSMGALQHAQDYECGLETVSDECTPGASGTDRYDAMASNAPFVHFSAPNKEALHWFDSNLVESVDSGGTFLIEPYETATSGIKTLKVPVEWRIDDLHGASAYYVSYRTPTGFDAGLTELVEDSVLIHLDGDRFDLGEPPVVGASLLLDMSPGGDADQEIDSADAALGVGEVFVDALNGISIEVLGRAGDALEVRVERTQYCGNGTTDPALSEACDGVDLAGATCSSIGWSSGNLSCSSRCEYDVSACGAPRCGPGHRFEPQTQTCTAEILVDPSLRALWANDPTWSGVRNRLSARESVDVYNYLFLLNYQRSDLSWIYRDSLPFDTSSIPDDADIIAAELHLKVLRASFPYVNSHPESADQLVLVRASLAEPPVAGYADYPFFGALDDPEEGAPRIDLGDVASMGDFEVAFTLDSTGIGWIDPTGFTQLGLRGGYDVDDVTILGEEPELRLFLRGDASPHAGPRLRVTYSAVPEPGLVAALVAGVLALLVCESKRGPAGRGRLSRMRCGQKVRAEGA